MLRNELFEQLAAARLLDFFAAESPWQRRLWDVGTCLCLREITEATAAVAAGALSNDALTWLRQASLPTIGPDVGLGTEAERRTLVEAVRSEHVVGGFHARVLAQLTESAETGYLARWSKALEAAPPLGAERTARAIAGHMLGVGFSPSYLHSWWSYRINHEPGERRLSELVAEAHQRTSNPPEQFDVIVPLARATERVAEIPGWLAPEVASDLLTPINRKPIAGLAGAIRTNVDALDPGAAVESMADLVDRYVARITLGGGGEGLRPFPYVWVAANGENHKRMRLRRPRGLEVPVLLRREEPITQPVAAGIDASLELLGPVEQGSAAPAVAGGWAAVETLLTAPGDRAKVGAADRLAALVTCSLPRAELTQLVHHFVAQVSPPDVELSERLAASATNTQAAAHLARHLSEHEVPFSNHADLAAMQRVRTILASPTRGLQDVEVHLQRVFRRLYRVRNLVLHNAATDSLTLSATLRTVAPVLGAGIDRVVRGALLQGIEPLDLAARSRIMIDNADNLGPGRLADLLDLAET